MLRFFIFLLFLLPSFSSLAAESVVVGESCTTLGASRMTTDQKNIVVCLKDDSGKLFWKASTQAASSDYVQMCGLATNYESVVPCKGADIYVKTCKSWSGKICTGGYQVTRACPSGYTMKSALTGQDTYKSSTGSHGEEVQDNKVPYYIYFCTPNS